MVKKIISNYAWPHKDMVGEKGELYVWLISQHLNDIDFQKSCLKLLEDLPKIKERNKHIEYLTDRILIKENKKQVYET